MVAKPMKIKFHFIILLVILLSTFCAKPDNTPVDAFLKKHEQQIELCQNDFGKANTESDKKKVIEEFSKESENLDKEWREKWEAHASEKQKSRFRFLSRKFSAELSKFAVRQI